MRIVAGALIAMALTGCGRNAIAECLEPKNAQPEYGAETGLPKNCRAIVQANIDGYRSKQYTADEIISSLERNCGANGYAWGE